MVMAHIRAKDKGPRHNPKPISIFNLNVDLDVIPCELWSWPIHVQKIKGQGQLVRRVETDGQTNTTDCSAFLAALADLGFLEGVTLGTRTSEASEH